MTFGTSVLILPDVVDLLRTPDERFTALPDFPFRPHYADVAGVRIHYLDEGPRDAAPVLLLHGEPSWSFLYRKMIPPLVAGGHRAIAPDMVGFGRSDKPARREDHTYQRHVEWMAALVERLQLREVTLFAQDWGGLIGLRLAAEDERRYARVMLSNTFLPTGDDPPSGAFLSWQRFAQSAPFEVGKIVARGCVVRPPPDVLAAYDAPFPDETYLAGPRQLPMLVPTTPDDPAAAPNRAAWERLKRWDKPVLCAFGARDPITRFAYELLVRAIPGARGQPHVLLDAAGHFTPEDAGARLASLLIDFIARK